MKPDRPRVFSGLGIESRPLDVPPTARARPYPELCRAGVVRAAVNVMLADMLAGFVSEAQVEHDWIFTTDLSVRVDLRPAPAHIDGVGRPVRIGRNIVVAEVELTADDGPYGYGIGSFIRVPRRHGDPEKPKLNEVGPATDTVRFDRPLAEEVGIEVTDPSCGAVAVPITDELRNPAGAMQGAIVGLTGEVAAETLADHVLGGTHVVTGLDIRYLNMGRVGPVRTHAAFVGDPAGGMIRVDLHDTGMDDRRMTSVIAHVSPT